MSVIARNGVVRLEGHCPVEDAEVLVRALQGGASCVDVSDCLGLHAAVLQALLVFKPPIVGAPASPPEIARIWAAIAGGVGSQHAKRSGASGA